MTQTDKSTGYERFRDLFFATLVLEFASGVPFGAINELVPIWLRVHGTDLASLGALTLVGLPWTLKPLWAPFVDRIGNWHSWIVLGMTVAAGSILGLTQVAGHSPGLVPLLVLAAMGSATADIAIDAYIVARVPPAEQGRVTGVRIASYRGAMALAGGGATWIGSRWGWNCAFESVVGLQLLVMAGVWSLKRVKQVAMESTPAWGRVLGEWLSRPGTWELFGLVLLFKLGDSAMAPMTRPFLLSAGLDAGQVGIVSTTGGSVLTAVGAVLGGALVSRFGMRSMFVGLGATQALSNLGYALAALVGGAPSAIAASIGESLTSGLGSAAMMSLSMRACRGAGEADTGGLATRWAILSGIIGLTRTLSGAISGVGVEQWGYFAWFMFTFALAFPALALAPRVVSKYTDA